MPPKTTSTPSCWMSFLAQSAAMASSVALSSRCSSRWRPRRPPLALMSPITMRATLAFARPMSESGPAWSAMTPTLMGSPAGIGDAVMISSLGSQVPVAGSDSQQRGGRAWWSTMKIETSGDLPISAPPLRLGELVAALALAQDNAFGQPLESQLRSCLLATWMCEAAGFEDELRETVYWVALLRYVGCTGHAHEVAMVFGDEIAIRAATLVHDAANPAEVMKDVMAYATAGRTPEEQEAIVKLIKETAREWAVYNFTSGCEVADMLLERLDFGPDVRDAIRFTFERWNGNGYPDHAAGEAIPLAMRVVHLSHDMEAIGRLFSPDHAVDAARDRRDRTYDPALADVFVEHGRGWLDELEKIDPWDAVLALEPEPHRILSGDQLDAALTVAADFIDLKSPYMGGHSRRCAELAGDAARLLGLDEDDVDTLRRAAFVHDFGTTVVPNSIW